MENIITHILTSIIIGALFVYLNKAVIKPVPKDVTGVVRLSMHKFYGMIGVASMIIGILFPIAAIASDPHDLSMYIVGVSMLLLFGGLGIVCYVYYRNHFAIFDAQWLEVQNVFGKKQTLFWHEIESAKFSAVQGMILVKDVHGKTVKLHQHLKGIDQFLQQLENAAGISKAALKFPNQFYSR